MNTKTATYLQDVLLDLIRVSDSYGYADLKKLTLQETPKGNYMILLAGKETGLVANRNRLAGFGSELAPYLA